MPDTHIGSFSLYFNVLFIHNTPLTNDAVNAASHAYCRPFHLRLAQILSESFSRNVILFPSECYLLIRLKTSFFFLHDRHESPTGIATVNKVCVGGRVSKGSELVMRNL